jgi:A/G-specific adenine glycosylase
MRSMAFQSRNKLFAKHLLSWWSKNKKEFSWRKTKDPYKVLIAELLLRKTTSKQVERIYDTLIARYPNPEKLAKSSRGDLKEILRHLGMEHVRTNIFIRLAKMLVQDLNGHIPSNEKGLRELPGIGKYSANAILCTAYGKDVPMVDTNAVRVIGRVFNFKSSKARVKDDPEIWDFVTGLIPSGKGKEFNLAVIDFAHGICLPHNPLCSTCPLGSICCYNLKLNLSSQ